MLGLIRTLDIWVFNFINHNLSPTFLDYPLIVLTELGNYNFCLYTGLALILLGQARLKKTGLVVVSSTLLTAILVNFLKNILAVSRPFISLEGTRKLVEAGGFSFPSAHSALAFCLAVVLADAFPRHRLKFYFFACIVGFSRIYLGVHFPSDVASGLILGFILGKLMARINRAIQ